MSIEAPNWYTIQYDQRVRHLLQSEGFLLRGTTDAPVEVKGNTLEFFFIGRSEAQPFGKTPERGKAAKVDLGQLISQELRMQVQSMLGDDKLPADGATPRSATEIMERMKRIQKNYMGAWARIVNEVIGLGRHGIEESCEFDRIGLRERRDLVPQRFAFSNHVAA
jgi:hypothetical protein